ncbi:hypothetical protein NM688_g2068 [Phlebia brevispora]|uniref:Uncharacterized protein n=1 Tax=Phlebia brevispora TaxID=194682 RepID=A0ACC1T9I5_9APHY|nr:hypothetical protein NM688_g2068 [Phlebia brevispora]
MPRGTLLRPTTPELSYPREDPTTPRARHRVQEPTTPWISSRSTRPPPQTRGGLFSADTDYMEDDPDNIDVQIFDRYDKFDVCQTLEHLLLSQLPPPPALYSENPTILSTTKDISKTERTLAVSDRLVRIVYAPNMLKSLIQEARRLLSDMRIDVNQVVSDFIAAVSPWHTSVGLADIVYSEKDVESWVMRVMLAPSLNVGVAFRLERIPLLQYRVVLRAGMRPAARSPFVSSAPSRGSIPDGIVVDVDKTVRATIEVKTHNVIMEKKKDTSALRANILTYEDRQNHIFAPLMKYHQLNGKRKPGFAIKFKWPSADELTSLSSKQDKDDDNENDTEDTQTRILVQMSSIWTQMLEHDCDIGMLSTYIMSLFYHREGQTLFVSRSYWNSEDILIATVAWMAMVLRVPGFETSKLELPKPNTSFWHEYEEITAGGIVRPYIIARFQMNLRRTIIAGTEEPGDEDQMANARVT